MIQWWQILLLTLYSAYQICDELTIVSSAGSPVFAGFITGLIMGDVTTGLLIGGNLQLFVLGVGTFGGAFVQSVVDFVEAYKWVADGLTLAGRMLPGLGFAILLRYLPVKRNLHYLAMGFGLTAMLTVLYSYVTGLGGAVAGIVGTLPAEVAEKIGFVNNFKGLSMIGISIVGIFLAVLHFKNSQKVAVAAPSTPSESGEIEDDEF